MNTEKSRFLKPESRKMFRPMVPNVPNAGGAMTELPFAKHPKASRVATLGAFAVQFAISVEEFEGTVAVWVTPSVVEQVGPGTVSNLEQ